MAHVVGTPTAEMWVFGNNFRSALFTWGKRRRYLETNHAKPPPARFGGSMRRSRAIKKKHAFLYVFSRAAKINSSLRNKKAGPFGAAALQGSGDRGRKERGPPQR